MSLAREWALPILGLIVLVASVGILLATGNTQVYVSGFEQPSPTPQVTQEKSSKLSFDKSSLELSSGQTQTVNLMISDGNNKISAAEIHLAFDSKIINIKEAKIGQFPTSLNILTNSRDNKKGTVVLALGTLKPTSGTGVIASFTIEAVGKGKSKISLDGSEVAVLGKTWNTLKNTQGLEVQVK